jgi:hypothetical protein
VAGDATPDFGRLLARGQGGMAILVWLATVLGALNDTASRLVGRGDPIFASAAQWLQATGLTSTGEPEAAPGGIRAS